MLHDMDKVLIKKVAETKINATYPDVVVACEEELFEDKHLDTLLNPLIIFEVLSETTEKYDRGKKFEHYQYIKSLLEYLLVAQDRLRIEQYTLNQEGIWTRAEFNQPDQIVRLNKIGCCLYLRDVYIKVKI